MYLKIIIVGIVSLLWLSACSNGERNVASDLNSENDAVENQETNTDNDAVENQETKAENDTVENKEQETNDNNGAVENQETAPNDESKVLYKENSFTSKQYTKGNINVSYPQLAHEDSGKANKMNSVITKDASYYFEKDYYEGYTGEIKYHIPFVNDEFVSITYEGLLTSPINSYPINLTYSTLVNMETGEKIRLNDLVNLDDAFVKAFKQGEIVTDQSSEYKQEIKKYIAGLDNQDLLKKFLEADKMNFPEVFVYVTEDSIVVTIAVVHALGDFIRVQISKDNVSFK